MYINIYIYIYIYSIPPELAWPLVVGQLLADLARAPLGLARTCTTCVLIPISINVSQFVMTNSCLL